jgi:uncharacterized membrane protein YfcA
LAVTAGADLGIFLVSAAAGLLGALAGVGGGILVIPALTILFHVDIRLAIGASIISVIATSSGAAAAYVRDRLTNLRIAMFLELATTSGAVAGALLAARVAPTLLYLLLGGVLVLSALFQIARIGEAEPSAHQVSPLARRLRLADRYFDPRLERKVPYVPIRIPLGFAMMAIAGLVSGLLGIGSGALKVIAMDGAMRLPLKVSSATSNFMIGVTAAASAGVYIGRGDVDIALASPVAMGVLLGAFVGARLLGHLSNRALRIIFVPVLAAVGVQTVLRGLGIGL